MQPEKRGDFSSNAILMPLLVVFAIGLGTATAVTVPRKNLQCLPHFSSGGLSETNRLTHTHTHTLMFSHTNIHTS